jgi:hypothetical protein
VERLRDRATDATRCTRDKRRSARQIEQLILPLERFQPTDRANARPMTGSVDTGSRRNQVYADRADLSALENASK